MKITIEFNRNGKSSHEDKTPKDFAIRPIDKTHKDIVLPMVEKFYHSDAVDHPVPTQTLEQTFRDVADPKNQMILGFLIECDGDVAGFFYLTFFYCCEVGGGCVMIEEIFIKDAFQGKGLGTKAMEWILRSYPKAKRFRLEVTDSNDGAIALYENLGFEFLDYQQMILDK